MEFELPIRNNELDQMSFHSPTTTTSTRTLVAIPDSQEQRDAAANEASRAYGDPEAHMRDPNVSDAIWTQLKLDKQAAKIAKALTLQELIRTTMESQMLQLASQVNLREKDGVKRQRKNTLIADAHEKLLENSAGEELEHDDQIQLLLREVGGCAQGYAWVRQEGGWRCEGGGHFMRDEVVAAFDSSMPWMGAKWRDGKSGLSQGY
jgi:hypothetical protein